MNTRFPRHILSSTRRAASHLRRSSAWLLFALSLTACSGDEAPLDDLPELRLTTGWTEAASRATVDNTWSGKEEITVMASNRSRTYTAQTDGSLLPGTDGALRWARLDTMHVSAYFAPVNGLKSTFKIETGQDQTDKTTGLTGFQRSDVLYALPTAVSYGQTAQLTFRHLCAMVNLTVTASDEVEDVNMSNAYIFFVNQQNTSGAVERSTGTVTQRAMTASNYHVTPEGVGKSSKAQKQVRALLVPQTCKNLEFIHVEFREEGVVKSRYAYVPTDSKPINLKAGVKYTLHLTLTKNGLVLGRQTIQDWDVETETITSDAPRT